MATNEKIKAEIQNLDIDSPLVELYQLDASVLGGTIYYFTPMTENGGNIVFNGITYLQLPVQISGMELPGDGRLPRPKMKVANVSLTFVGLINAYHDAIGAKVSRIRTFAKYIDGHAEADANAMFPQDVFYIEQKTGQNKNYIEWELVSPLDFGEKRLPRNQVLSYCQHRYRIHNGVSFDYTYTTCPYTGTDYFNLQGSTVTASADKCGKKLSDCKLRYPLDTDQLPFKGFPGIGQLSRRAYR